MNNEKLEVIIDGANIFHDDRGIRKFDEDGEKIMQSRPERLAAAISFCIISKYVSEFSSMFIASSIAFRT